MVCNNYHVGTAGRRGHLLYSRKVACSGHQVQLPPPVQVPPSHAHSCTINTRTIGIVRNDDDLCPSVRDWGGCLTFGWRPIS
jgi:hypothetical protein